MKNKVRFKSCLQTRDEINQNRRRYPGSVLDNGMNANSSKMKNRAFYNELDHPLKQGNRAFDMQRQTTVLLREASHIITNWEWQGNKLVAEMETLSTPLGFTLHGLIKDKTGVGFSMRGMGELQEMDGFNDVKDPLTIICFDSVSNPSHKAAVVNFNEIHFESKLITESLSTICCGGHCFLPEYFDKLVESKIITFADRWV
jgi:hypothetical protein